eukprot:TRINITY_DN58974_c0_g3_i1.p1 TRINITY_DN58974_c0_g3~~TRINITY_DN58974_c0_g3_i1.p1  ORF type:complete len:215 (+),score=13.51 TRINITY_DN58974_c0_g3_i1:223-867(+)
MRKWKVYLQLRPRWTIKNLSMLWQIRQKQCLQQLDHTLSWVLLWLTPVYAIPRTIATQLAKFRGQKKIIDTYHTAAVDSNAKIVNTCGYECIPHDLGTYLVVQHAKKTYGRGIKQVQVLLQPSTRGGFSGGTIASLSSATEGLDKEEVNDFFTDGMYLVPKQLRAGTLLYRRSCFGTRYIPSVKKSFTSSLSNPSVALDKEAIVPPLKPPRVLG